MVSRVSYYDLEQVRQAAKAGRIQYSRLASRDIASLGYQVRDVCSCLLYLTTDEFDKTHNYPGSDRYLDAYKTRFARPDESGEYDDLYVKFALVDGQLMVALASFHLQRFG